MSLAAVVILLPYSWQVFPRYIPAYPNLVVFEHSFQNLIDPVALAKQPGINEVLPVLAVFAFVNYVFFDKPVNRFIKVALA